MSFGISWSLRCARSLVPTKLPYDHTEAVGDTFRVAKPFAAETRTPP